MKVGHRLKRWWRKHVVAEVVQTECPRCERCYPDEFLRPIRQKTMSGREVELVVCLWCIRANTYSEKTGEYSPAPHTLYQPSFRPARAG